MSDVTNGLLIQWIKYSGIGGDGSYKQLTLPLAYDSKNYYISLADVGNVGAGHDYQGCGIDSVQTVYVRSAGGSGWFITIGKSA